MVRIFIDLEMNMVSQKNTELRAALPHEIIEIGAVKLDESCRVIDRFRSYVRPRHNTSVHWTVAKLTGITSAELKKADYLEDVMPRFVEWAGTNESVRLYAWSNSDQAQVERECSYKKLWTPAMRSVFSHWTDFQKVFSRMVGYRNGMSLSRAVEYMGLDFAGDKHDALSDAENCARLLALMQDEEEFARRRALVPPEPVPQRKPKKPKAEETGETAQPDGSAAEANDQSPEQSTAKTAPGAQKAGAEAETSGKKPRRRRHQSRRSKAKAEEARNAAAGGKVQDGTLAGEG